MERVVIHNCRLRIVRHGGWSWGPDPRALVRSAVNALPGLLAACLREIATGDEDVEITRPLKIRLRVRSSDLATALASYSAGAPEPRAAASAIEQQLGEALRRALPFADDTDLVFDDARGADNVAATEKDSRRSWPGRPIERLLVSWRLAGVLLSHLELLSEPVLEIWCDAVFSAGHDAWPAQSTLSAELFERARQQAIEIASELPMTPADRATSLRARLLAAAELSLRLSLPPGHPAIVRAVEEISLSHAIPGGDKEERHRAESPRHVANAESFAAETIAPAAPLRTPRHPPRRIEESITRECRALPFLLLGPLSRTGYLEAVAAVFEAAQLESELPLFAAALAHKVLPPPERGWRRHPASSTSAAVFAGLAEPPPENALTGLAHKIVPFLDPLHATLAGSLVAGHERGKPLVLTRAGDGILLTEADGRFPVAWAPEFNALLPVLRQLSDEVILLPADSVAHGLLRALDEAGLRFLTPAAPARGESWHGLWLRSSERWWTNDAAMQISALARQAARLAGASEDAGALWQSLAVERPAVPLAPDISLDRALTLAAAVSLAAIAWILWRERESPSPLLTLERFGDLDGRVTFRRDSVRVLLPMGRRHQDLFSHGLLEPVRDAPWLNGRIIEFGGG